MNKLLSEIHGGHVNCDVCGDHNVRLEVYAYPGDKYRVVRHSQCYGSYDGDDLTREQALAEIAKGRGLMHIRRAIQATRKLEHQIAAGLHAMAPAPEPDPWPVVAETNEPFHPHLRFSVTDALTGLQVHHTLDASHLTGWVVRAPRTQGWEIAT